MMNLSFFKAKLHDLSKRYVFLRFLISGGINTVLTFLIFILAAKFVHHSIAYTMCYLAGIAMAYLMSSRYVFAARGTLRRALCFPIAYAVQYSIGLMIIEFAVTGLGVSNQTAIISAIAANLPISFATSRFIFRSV